MSRKNTPATLDPEETPPAERARIAEVRRAIAAGTYRIDPDRLAEALLVAGVINPKRTP